MDQRAIEAMEHWNRFVRRFAMARTSWEQMRKLFESDSGLFDRLPVEAQQVIGKTLYKAPFEVMADDLGMLFWHVEREEEYLVPEELINALKPKKKEESDEK